MKGTRVIKTWWKAMNLQYLYLGYKIYFEVEIYSHIFMLSLCLFQVFVANPNKPKPILEILLRNKEKLVDFLTRFHNDRSEDEQFNDEKAYLIKQIRELRPLDEHHWEEKGHVSYRHNKVYSKLHTIEWKAEVYNIVVLWWYDMIWNRIKALITHI